MRNKNKILRNSGKLSTQEYQNARDLIIKLIQRENYEKELVSLKKKQSVDNLSESKALNPYTDIKGIIRVGGRLENASTLHQKNPIILPKHYVTTLIIRSVHPTYFHCGVNSTLNAVRYNYWPIDGRAQVRTILIQCVRFTRAKPRENNYIMDSLPAPRVQPSIPFLHTGVDFCGPFGLKEKNLETRKLLKCMCQFLYASPQKHVTWKLLIA